MIKDITLIGGFWNCADRAHRLLTAMRPWFENIIIAVQESPDDTFDVVSQIADVTLPDAWHRHGNPSFQLANSRVGTPWSFLISDDEVPDDDLLNSLNDLIVDTPYDGFWFHFRSWIDDIEFTREQDNHLRLWKSKFPWPRTIHSRPMIENTTHSNIGHIEHSRSLDEMMDDYLRRYQIGIHNNQWVEHNKRMMNKACEAVAEHKGWDYVTAKPWWPQVREIAFDGGS